MPRIIWQKLLIAAPAALLLLLLVLSLPSVAGPLQERTSGPGDTWTVVAVDPESGNLGIAGASCVPLPIDAVAALVPGKGVAAVQADFTLRNRNRVYDLLQAGVPAGEIIAEVTAPAFDPQASLRQYGIITIPGEPEVAAYTGADNFPWAGDAQAAAVAVQGNFLEGEAVVAEALAAFLAEAGPLSDRLLAALVAGSVAGGDRRCNQDGVQQTAAAAFIMVAQAGQPPFVVPVFGVSQVGEPGTPWLYLSVTEPIGGENAVDLLQHQYVSWRAEQPLPETRTEADTRADNLPVALLLLAAVLVLLPVLLLTRARLRP